MSFDFKPEPWMERSACRGMPTEIFFPGRGRPAAQAIKVCNRCPVKKQCTEYANRTNTLYGIWGGVLRDGSIPKPEPDEEEPVIPTTFSATALQNYLDCPARYFAENIRKGATISGDAASLGTACHQALQDFVEQGHYKSGLKLADQQGKLIELYRTAYWGVFSEASRFEEGWRLMLAWLKRQDWEGRTVVSTEKKLTFDLPTSHGIIPVTYIMDRLDVWDDGTPEVFDYKTLSRPISIEQLRNKLQARIYALAAMIMYPKAEHVWVTFDMLRYEPIGIRFSKQDCRDTWNFLINLAERILADDDPQERLGDGCRFCVRKSECKTLLSHIEVGGILGVTDVPVMVQRKHDIDAALVGLRALSDDIDKALVAYLKNKEAFDEEVGEFTIKATLPSRRFVPAERVAAVVGDDLFNQYGAETITMARFDDLVKDPALTNDQRSQLQQLVGKNYGDSHIKIEPKKVA